MQSVVCAEKMTDCWQRAARELVLVMQSVTIDGITISAKYPGTIPYPQMIEIERTTDGLRYRYIDPPSGWLDLAALEKAVYDRGYEDGWDCCRDCSSED